MAHRALWDDKAVLERLGAEGYQWFLERAERFIAACPECKGSGEILVPDPMLSHGRKDGTAHRMLGQCTNCRVYAELLANFVYGFHYYVPPAYRWCILSRLKPYEGTSSIVPLERQQTILDMLRAEPEKSYMFFGPAHAGKTVWTTALSSRISGFIGCATAATLGEPPFRGSRPKKCWTGVLRTSP